MPVAVLADIHGNLPALEAVLSDVDAAGANVIVLNGDLATGPMPAQTLDRPAPTAHAGPEGLHSQPALHNALWASIS